MITIIGVASRAIAITLNQLLTEKLLGSHTTVATRLEILNQGLQDTLTINGAAVFKEDIMVDSIDKQQTARDRRLVR